MQQFGRYRVAWVRALLLATTAALVVGTGTAYAQVGVKEVDLDSDVATAAENASNDVASVVESETEVATTGGAGDAVNEVTSGAGDAVNEVTGGAGDAVNEVTGGAGDAVNEVTGGAGDAVNGVTGPSGGAGDNTSDLPAKLIAGVPPRVEASQIDTDIGSRDDGISFSKRQQISEDPFFSEKGVSNDLPSVVQAPGSALGEAADASGSLELPFGLGTLPLTGVELALIMLTALATAVMGCVIVRMARTKDAPPGGAPGLQTT